MAFIHGYLYRFVAYSHEFERKTGGDWTFNRKLIVSVLLISS